MAEEEKQDDLFGSIDLSVFEEASQFLSERMEQEEETKEIDSNEEVEQENQEDEDKKDPSSQDIKTDSSHLTPYFKLLVEEGLFDSSEEWDGTAEGLINLENKKLNAWKEQYKAETLDPRVKWLQDNLEEGVPFEQLLQLDNEATMLESITPEKLVGNIELQREVAKEYYRQTTRFSEDRINRDIARLEEAGELEGESQAFSKELVNINEAKKAQALKTAQEERLNEEKQQKEQLKVFKETLRKTEEIIPGLKVTDVMKDKIDSTLTTIVATQDGVPLNKIAKARMEDPMGFEIKLAYLFELTNGFKDWAPLNASGRKQAYKNFEEAAKQIDTKGTRTTSHAPDNNDFLKELDGLYKKGLIR